LFGIGGKLPDRVDRHRVMHGDEKRSLDELSDRHEVFERIE